MTAGFRDKRTGQVKGRQCHLCPHYMTLPPGTDYYKTPCAHCYGVGDLEGDGGATDSREQGHGRGVSADALPPQFLATLPAPVGEDAEGGEDAESGEDGGARIVKREELDRIVFTVAQLTLPELVGIWNALRGNPYNAVARVLDMTPQGVHISTVRGLKRLGVWDVWRTNVKARRALQERIMREGEWRKGGGLGTAALQKAREEMGKTIRERNRERARRAEERRAKAAT